MLSSLNLKIKAVSCGLLVLCTLLSAGLAWAQNPITAKWNVPVTFQTLAQTTTSQDYTIVQLRRFFTNSGVVTVRERARVNANGTRNPDFEFDFLGVEGEPQGAPLWQEWAQVYGDHGRLFFEHGLFRVRCLAKVYQNYGLHSFGATTRIGRAAQRIIVFPNMVDKSIWLLEVDTITNVPLYMAEYDAQLGLLSEVEAVSFSLGAQLGPTTGLASLVTTLPTIDDARAFMGQPVGLVEPTGATGEYGLDQVKVRIDPLNNRQTLVLEYTDGVDQFFVTETFGVSDLFSALPVRQRPGVSHTIARYRDPAMSVLLFWDAGVSFQVAGRGSLLRLDDFAQAIYTMAIYNR